MSTRERLPRWGQAKNEAILRNISSATGTDRSADEEPSDESDAETA
ncbi:hypothetical protein [Natrononativus amylolyticus]|nr:hypothetical protein [Natrononativus amylolyticus]